MTKAKKKMTQAEAWEDVAKAFSNVKPRRGILETKGKCSGMCSHIEKLWSDDKLSIRNKNRMFAKIDKAMKFDGQCFLFARTIDGAKERVKFANRQARLLTRKQSKPTKVKHGKDKTRTA